MLDMMIALALGAVASVVLWLALLKSMDEHHKPKRPKKSLFKRRAEPQTPNHFGPPARADHPTERRAPGLANKPHDPNW